jgi:serine/threonine protein kinase
VRLPHANDMTGGEGTVFGKYFLLKKIATGGMGEIFLAKLKGPVGFEKVLVVKRILHHHLENQEFVDMFFAEARVAASLTHSNIVQIYEMGEIEDSYYIAMEYVHGKPLRDVLDRARSRGESVHPSLVVEMISKVCEGMSYAHNSTNMSGERIGIVHRDINPHNLLVSYSGEVKIIDFGIAKTQMSSHKTETGTIKGKFVYMSPEQSAAEPLDKRSDLFALGICLYESLTFVNPFAKQNVVLSLDAIQRTDPPPVSQTNPRLAVFDPVIAKALAKKPDDRYSDCIAFRDALRSLKRQNLIEEAPQSLSELMHELFEEQIESEKRTILETDSASTGQIKLMQAGINREHDSGSHGGFKLEVEGQSSPGPAKLAAHASASAVVLPKPLPHSRLPFLLILAAILTVSGVAAAIVFNVVQNRRLGILAQTSPLVQVVTPPTPPTPPPDTAVAMLPAPSPALTPATTPAPDADTEADSEPTDDPAKARKEPKKTRVDRPKAESAATKAAGADSAFGSLQVSTIPPVKIIHNGIGVGQTFKLKGAIGKIQFGSGKDPTTDPFTVKVRYKVEGDSITYLIDAEPWAIVRGAGGIGLGKTPLPPQTGTGTSTFEFVNPKEKIQQRVTVRFSR